MKQQFDDELLALFSAKLGVPTGFFKLARNDEFSRTYPLFTKILTQEDDKSAVELNKRWHSQSGFATVDTISVFKAAVNLARFLEPTKTEDEIVLKLYKDRTLSFDWTERTQDFRVDGVYGYGSLPLGLLPHSPNPADSYWKWPAPAGLPGTAFLTLPPDFPNGRFIIPPGAGNTLAVWANYFWVEFIFNVTLSLDQFSYATFTPVKIQRKRRRWGRSLTPRWEKEHTQLVAHRKFRTNVKRAKKGTLPRAKVDPKLRLRREKVTKAIAARGKEAAIAAARAVYAEIKRSQDAKRTAILKKTLKSLQRRLKRFKR